MADKHLDRFYIEVLGDATPYNDPLELILGTIPSVHESTKQRIIDLVSEIGNLSIMSGPKKQTLRQYYKSNDSFVIDVIGDARPFNSLKEITNSADE